MENPTISVIIPVYRVEAYLDACLASVTGQRYENLEILLVDDGSPDRCGQICDDWAAKDSRIRVIHKENGGAGQARNVALAQATGELIGFVDSDDYISPDLYAHLYSLMDGETDIAECGYTDTLDDSAVFDSPDVERRAFTPEEAMQAHIQDTLFQQVIWNKLYRRQVVEGISFPEGNLIDDEFWTYRVLGRARKLVHSEARMYAYRQQPDSAMHKPFSRKRLQGMQAKLQRLTYLDQRMPQLVDLAAEELWMTCLYAMQGSLKGLSGEELALAKQEIGAVADQLPPVVPDSGKRRMLLALARHSLPTAARLLNILIDLHILN